MDEWTQVGAKIRRILNGVYVRQQSVRLAGTTTSTPVNVISWSARW